MYSNNYSELYHYGVPGMRKGVRRWTNADGTLNAAGKNRYYVADSDPRYARSYSMNSQAATRMSSVSNSFVKDNASHRKVLTKKSMSSQAATASARDRRRISQRESMNSQAATASARDRKRISQRESMNSQAATASARDRKRIYSNNSFTGTTPEKTARYRSGTSRAQSRSMNSQAKLRSSNVLNAENRRKKFQSDARTNIANNQKSERDRLLESQKGIQIRNTNLERNERYKKDALRRKRTKRGRR